MSQEGNLENAPGEPAEALEVIKEEESQNKSSNHDAIEKKNKKYPEGCCKGCKCVHLGKPPLPVEKVEELLKQKEEELTARFQEQLQKEMDAIKERAEFILQNEQVRASYMLREAHRERQEKIGALQTQLACKNLAGLMYVMCTERKRCKMEKLAIIEEYTAYILALQEILAEAQTLILNLSKGYKTAARVDHEWREKMKKTLEEFQMFVHDFTKGTPETDQYFFDLPKLLKTKAPLQDNPAEDPCSYEIEDAEEEEEKQKKQWFERLDDETYPFVSFGDMADFKPPQRRETLRAIKKIKTAPKKWKEYVFHNMFVSDDCCNASAIKDEYAAHIPPPRWECAAQPDAVSRQSTQLNSPTGRRATALSIDVRGGMGSIIKMITTTNGCTAPVQNKALLLGARDSMEIASTTKLRERHRQSDTNKVVINVGTRRTSFYPTEDELDNDSDFDKPMYDPSSSKEMDTLEEDENESSASVLGSMHNDSLTVIQTHRHDQDHNIHYEKVCPMEKCQRLQVDSFVRSLPPYMRASPFHHFEQSFEGYEACSPEQLAILRQRIEDKKNRERAYFEKPEENPLDEWNKVDGIGVQTSVLSISLPPCTCMVGPTPTPNISHGQIYNVRDLQPMKQVLNQINRDCFYDDNIEFNRFQVIGEDADENIKKEKDRELVKSKTQGPHRLREVTRILKQHPSLLDIFQANTA